MMNYTVKSYPELEIRLDRTEIGTVEVELRFSNIDEGMSPPVKGSVAIDQNTLLALWLEPEKYGQALTKAVFQDPAIREHYSLQMGKLGGSVDEIHRSLRVRFFITDPELESLRWELLQDPISGHPMAIHPRMFLSRFLANDDWRSIRLEEKRDLRALVVVSAPDLREYPNLAPIERTEQVAQAKEALAGIEVEVLDEPLTLEKLCAALADSTPDVLLLVSHGTFHENEGALLLLQEESGEAHLVPGVKLARKLAGLDRVPRLAVLASCESADRKAHSVSAFEPLAPLLAASGVPAIVAMHGEVTMETLALALPIFFQELLEDSRIDRAMSKARLAVWEERHDFWIPALFMRLRQGSLWSDEHEAAEAAENGEGVQKRFDAFLNHSDADKAVVKEIARRLENQTRLKVWLDEWNLVPGEPRQEGIERALDDSKCCVVFFGTSGPGEWQEEKMRSALAERVAHGRLRVVPVLLPGAERPERESELPAFLRRLTWVRFTEDVTDEEGFRGLVCGIRGKAPGRRTIDSDDVCPYRGLEVFRSEDRHFFFGREALVERLFDFIQLHRFMMLTGPSGSGKSSVVQAGLVPKLEDGETLIAAMTPRERPLEELAFALRRCLKKEQIYSTEKLLERLETSSRSLHLVSREMVEAAEVQRLILVVDQFEELFTQTVFEEERGRFVANLLGAVDRSGPTLVILTMRSDFLGHCALHPDLNLFVEEHLKQIGPMSREELERAIVGPAHMVGLTFEDGLVQEILDDIQGSPGELPLLQHALLELYNRRDGTRLNLRAYQETGRIEGALTRRAEEEFEKLDNLEKETLRKMFVLCLVTAGQGTEDTRRRATRDELLAVGQDPRIAESLLVQWTDARLLTTRSDSGRQQLVDVAHEALIRKWGRLQSWMAEDREQARHVNVLRQEAEEWHRKGQHEDYLLYGAKLFQANSVMASQGGDLTELERSFVAASGHKARRRVQLMVIGVILALGLAAFLVQDSHRSERTTLRQLARNYWNESQAARDAGHALRSLHFLSESIATNPDPKLRESQFIDLEQDQPKWALTGILEHQDWVHGAVFSSDESRVLTWRSGKAAILWDASTGEAIGSPLEHQGGVYSSIFKSDGSWVLTWGRDNTARLWDATTGEAIGPVFEHEGPVWGAAFNGDGSHVLTWSRDNTARLWDTVTGGQIGPALEHEGPVVGAVFDDNQSRVLTWSIDNTARLWDASTGEKIGPALEHEGPVMGAVFNDDESRVLTRGHDNTARLWDASTGASIGPPLEHQGGVLGAVFNGVGSCALTWGRDNTARLWDAITGEAIGPALKHQGTINGAVFNSVGSRVLTWSEDKTTRLWDVSTGEAVGPALEHRGPVNGAVFDGAGNCVLTWSDDYTARLWDAVTGEAIGLAFEHQRPVWGALFNGDESRVLTWSFDGTARLWNVATGEAIGGAFEHQGPVLGALFNGDENRVLTWSTDKTVRLWDAAMDESIGSALKHEGSVFGAVFNGAGSRVLTWSSDNTARLWDAVTGEAIGPQFEHRGWVWGAMFNGDESRVLTWSLDWTARLWDAATGESIGPSLEHRGPIWGAMFNGDESRVLTWSDDSTARLWDASTGEALGPALEHQGGVLGAVFNDDGSRVLTSSEDKTARLWDAITGEAIGPPLKHRGPVRGAVFNGDGSRVLTWSDDKTARLWGASTGEAIGPALEHQGGVFGAVFNSGGSRVLTWGRDYTARLWDAVTGEAIGPPLEHEGSVLGALFNGDESRVLTWGYENRARLWDAATGEAIGVAFEHQGGVLGALFNGDESRLLTWSKDKTARLWDVLTGKAIGPPLKHEAPVKSGVFSSDESRVLTLSENKMVHLWDVGADFDFPREFIRLQARALTGFELVPETGETRRISRQRWREMKRDWEEMARAHYEVCSYPEYNIWKRFYPEEAEKVRR